MDQDGWGLRLDALACGKQVAHRDESSTNSDKYEGIGREHGGVSIAIFPELAWFLNNKPLFVKASHQYHEVVKLHSGPTNC